MTVKNILLKVLYDGTNFSGYQIQNDKRSVQEELEKAIRKVTGEKNRIIAAGRTDSGVHSNSQYVNFLTASEITPDKFFFHLKSYLPADIIVTESKEVDINFHARFSAHSKTYKYLIYRGKIMHPVYNNYMEHVTYRLDFEKLQEGLDLLLGEHDFKSFMFTEKNAIINTKRRIDNAYYISCDDKLEIYFTAESFLHNQVRMMVGSLIELARGKISLEDFSSYLDSKSDKKAGPTFSASGLYLEKIVYWFIFLNLKK